MRKIVFMLATMMAISTTSSAAVQAAETQPATTDSQATLIEVSPSEATALRDASYMVDFGAVPVGMSAVRSFRLSNTGNRSLFIGGVHLTGADYSAAMNCPRALPPRTYCTFNIRFQPDYVGYQEGEMYIRTNAGLITLILRGWGRDYRY